MKDVTKEEFKLMYPDHDNEYIDSMVIKLSKPSLCFEHILVMLNKKAIEMGYKSYDDFLIKSGWKKRFENV